MHGASAGLFSPCHRNKATAAPMTSNWKNGEWKHCLSFFGTCFVSLGFGFSSELPPWSFWLWGKLRSNEIFPYFSIFYHFLTFSHTLFLIKLGGICLLFSISKRHTRATWLPTSHRENQRFAVTTLECSTLCISLPRLLAKARQIQPYVLGMAQAANQQCQAATVYTAMVLSHNTCHELLSLVQICSQHALAAKEHQSRHSHSKVAAIFPARTCWDVFKNMHTKDFCPSYLVRNSC